MYNFFISLCFLIISLMIQASPRLLIGLDSNCKIKPEQLAKKMKCHFLLNENLNELEIEINKLDQISNNHLIIIKASKSKLEALASNIGYEYIYIEGLDIEAACKVINKKEKTVPTTDAYLPRIDSKKAGLLYALMLEVDKVLRENNIIYWATCGTLLGAIRHKGLIPWDDDLDICIDNNDVQKLLSLKTYLAKRGLQITMHPNGWYKIHFIYGKKIKKNDTEYFEWTFPFVDIFPVSLDLDKKVRHATKATRELWPSEYFLSQELVQPFNYASFGPMLIPVPHNITDILNRFYGNDWNRVTYISYDHENEKTCKKIKVDLVDRSAISYLLPGKDFKVYK